VLLVFEKGPCPEKRSAEWAVRQQRKVAGGPRIVEAPGWS
jgi:hypothetical protein